jgi:hypothetical protein
VETPPRLCTLGRGRYGEALTDGASMELAGNVWMLNGTDPFRSGLACPSDDGGTTCVDDNGILLTFPGKSENPSAFDLGIGENSGEIVATGFDTGDARLELKAPGATDGEFSLLSEPKVCDKELPNDVPMGLLPLSKNPR